MDILCRTDLLAADGSDFSSGVVTLTIYPAPPPITGYDYEVCTPYCSIWEEDKLNFASN